MNAIDVRQIKQISSHNSYHGWPTLLRRRDGELLATVSAGRDRHVCPFGQVHILRSADNGETWKQELLVNGPLDDRDSGIIETRRGTLLVNWFTSIAWLVKLELAEKEAGDLRAGLGDRFMAQCQKIRSLLDEQTITRELGPWIMRSEDGGKTWSQKINPLTGSPHGPTELADGRLLYVGQAKAAQRTPNGSPYDNYLSATESLDDGKTWQVVAKLPMRAGDRPGVDKYCEPHAVQAADGRIIVHIRNHSERDKGWLLQSESADGGKTWSEPHTIGLQGHPCHLLRLADGRLLATYGYRHDPYGNRISVSADNGNSWSRPLTLSAEEAHRDIGYPSSAELADGNMLSIWYEAVPVPGAATKQGVVRQARWSWA